MQPGLAQAGLFEQALPLVVVGVRVERLAGRGGEHPAFLVPLLPCLLPFPILLGLVRAEQLDELGRQPDRAAARPGLNPAGGRAGADTLRASSRGPAAAAAAAVLVLGPQPRTADAQDAVIEVYVLPPQTQCLPLPQAQRQGQGPPGAVAPSAGYVQQALDLLDAVRLDFLFLQLRRLGQQHRVASQVGSPDSLVQGGPQRPVDVVSTARGHPVALKLRVQALHMLGRELLQAVGADPGNEVVDDVNPVPGMGVLRYVRWDCDGADPMLKPLGDGPALTGRSCGAAVALPLQGAYLPGHLGAGGTPDVAPIGPPVVAHAHRDPADPTPVLVLVDRGSEVRAAGAARAGSVPVRRHCCHWRLPGFVRGAVKLRTRRGNPLGLGFRLRNAIDVPSTEDLAPNRLSLRVDEEGRVWATIGRRTFLVGISAALLTQMGLAESAAIPCTAVVGRCRRSIRVRGLHRRTVA